MLPSDVIGAFVIGAFSNQHTRHRNLTISMCTYVCFQWTTYTSMSPLWLHQLSVLSTASLATATHSKLLNSNAKANDATVLKPKLGKLGACTRAGVS
eukprot:473004-Amphidinium_carterae.2